MKQPLNYETPRPLASGKRARWRTLIFAGVIAGGIAVASLFLGGLILAVLVTGWLGVILSAVVGLASQGQEIRAGVMASGFASATASMSGAFIVGVSEPDAFPVFLVVSAISFVVWWLLFAIPGLFGSLWVLEGRRPRPWDQLNREK